MTEEQFDDQLPETMSMKVDNQSKQDENLDLLEKLIDHVDHDQYIPWEKVQLPSRGVYYGDQIPDGYVEVRPMGVDVDKMLSNQRLIKSGQLVNKIVETCTRFPHGFDIRNMLVGDLNFLIYYLRGITHGPIYEFVSECPTCGTKNTYEFDLMELGNTIKGPNPEWPEEPMTITLPALSKSFDAEVQAMVRLIRVDDIMRMSRPGRDDIYDPVKRGRARVRNKNNNKSVNKQMDVNDKYNDGMKLQIVGFVVNGAKYTDDRRFKIIDKLHQQDTATIRDFIEDISPSVDVSLEVECQNEECGVVSTISLPWSEQFFRPAK